MITTLTDLRPDARAAAEAWLAEAVAGLDADLAAALTDELRSVLLDCLDAEATPADVAALVDGLGLSGTDAADPAEAASPSDPRVGTFAGIPYDWRPPSGERIKRTLWDPASAQLWKPRAFGAGWDLNLGALAVRLGLIEPDAEDEPFTHTPDAAFAAAAALPVALAGAVVAHYAVRDLPDTLPAHWDWRGAPDRWTPLRRAAAQDVALTVGAAAIGAGAGLTRGDRPARAGALGVAATLATAGAVVTVWRSASDEPRWWAGPLLALAAVGSAGATLLGLAYAGRAAEQRRDLGAR